MNNSPTIVYISNVCSKNYFNKIVSKNSIKLSSNIQNHHNLLVEGLDKNDIKTKIISVQPLNINRIGYYKSEYEQINKREYFYISALNLPLIRHIYDLLISFITVLKINFFQKDIIFFVDILIAKHAFSSILVAKLLRKKIVGFISDNPNDMYLGRFSFERFISNLNIKLCNSYVLVTEYQAELINQSKKYIVIESQCNIENINYEIHQNNDGFILFAGALSKINGVDILLKGFNLIKDKKLILNIYGVGELEEMVLEFAKKNRNIKYLGYAKNDQILIEERKAKLLIIPRPIDLGISKYSFPIKLMEYMSSGTPVLTSDFKSIPEEYKKYLLFINDVTENGIAMAIDNTICLENDFLQDIGYNARKWIYENKNNIVQSKKLYNFLVNGWEK